jgi:hypothetical protein
MHFLFRISESFLSWNSTMRLSLAPTSLPLPFPPTSLVSYFSHCSTSPTLLNYSSTLIYSELLETMDTEMSDTNEKTSRNSNENTPRNANENAPRDALDKETALARASDHEEMRQWAKRLKINKPIPADLLPILAKDGAKQIEIFMKNMSLGRQEN